MDQQDNLTRRLTFRLSAADVADIAQIARDAGVSASQLMRDFIKRGVAAEMAFMNAIKQGGDMKAVVARYTGAA